MYINFNTSMSFKRRLNPSEEAEYCDVFKRGRSLVSKCDKVKDVLIIPVSSLPQNEVNNTGVGNMLSDESTAFFDFVKKYWGINEVQLLPVGQYHNNSGQYPPYSGTTMDFGNHLIDIKSVLPKEDFEKLVNKNSVKDSINFSNVVDKNSTQENLLKKFFRNLSGDLKSDFEKYKGKNKERLTPKSIFVILTEKYGNSDYKNWDRIDSNLFNESIVSKNQRNKRIAELLRDRAESADYYIFKQFLAEKSLKEAKVRLNKKGLKLNGDIPCGFSSDEVWANPKAFLKDSTIGWGMPALDFRSTAAENLLRKKIRLYAENFDGFRLDAAWTYTEPVITDIKTGQTSVLKLGDKFLKIIEDEVKNVKGNQFNLKNITYEFAADPAKFNIFDGFSLKPYAQERVKIYTSDYLTEDWGSANVYIKRGWNPDTFMLGAANHDSKEIKFNERQAVILSDILKVPVRKLKSCGDFLNAKFAEPLSGKFNMLFFMPALGIKGQYKGFSDTSKDYTCKIPANFEELYIKALKKNEAYNPMYGLELQFIAQGLDKSNPKLFKQIQKYRKILQDKGCAKKYYIAASVAAALLLIAGVVYSACKKSNSNRHQ